MDETKASSSGRDRQQLRVRRLVRGRVPLIPLWYRGFDPSWLLTLKGRHSDTSSTRTPRVGWSPDYLALEVADCAGRVSVYDAPGVNQKRYFAVQLVWARCQLKLEEKYGMLAHASIVSRVPPRPRGSYRRHSASLHCTAGLRPAPVFIVSSQGVRDGSDKICMLLTSLCYSTN
jgi:hypothetical protein